MKRQEKTTTRNLKVQTERWELFAVRFSDLISFSGFTEKGGVRMGENSSLLLVCKPEENGKPSLLLYFYCGHAL